MPPKKSSVKRAKPTASASPSSRSAAAGMSPGLGAGVLPNIPTKTSFAYGSSATPILPHMLAAKPKMDLNEMAENIENAVQVAKDREQSSSASGSPARRSRRIASKSPQRNQRQPTPDEVQLLTSLNEASSATPSTPVRHALSSRNSTPPREVTAKQVYPPDMHKPNSPILAPATVMSDLNGYDNSSIISYNVERNVHDDDLKRAHSNIAAPPRRFIGGFNDIEEEDEPYSPVRKQSPVPTRTIIPDRPSSPIGSWSDDWSGYQQYLNPKDGLFARIVQAIIGLLLIYAMFTFVMDAPSPNYKSPIRFNNSNLDALSHQVSALGLQVTSLNKDMKSVRAEVSRMPAPTTVFSYPSKGRPEIHKTNFLSVGHGIIVDPYLTSPSAGRKLSYVQQFYMWLAGDKHLQPQPPLAAFHPWEDFGECWCSAPKKGMTQIGVVLGQRIVPEDVTVEHLPKGATIRPGVAPQDIELWARYRWVGGARPYRWSWTSWFRGYPENVIGQDNLAPDRKIIRPAVMEALRIAWRGEPDTAFSDDKMLGQDFFRIAKFSYDINEKSHIQSFPVNAYIESDDLRVDKVVFRVKSNWGGNMTCLYRLKLHGKF